MKNHKGLWRLTVVALIILSCSYTRAQSFSSIGEGLSTKGTLKYENLFGRASDSVNIKKDTLISGVVYFLYEGPGEQGLLREDLDLGKFYFTNLNDNVEKLICDLSLSVGDSFYLDPYWHPEALYTKVVEVVTVNGMKQITFDFELPYAKGEFLRFIEGVGTNLGFSYLSEGSGLINPYLLCLLDETQQIYSNNFYDGQCEISTSGIHNTAESKEMHISLYPNPTNDFLHVEFGKNAGFGTLQFFDGTGKRVKYLSDFQSGKSIDVSELKNGTYTVRVQTNTNSSYYTSFTKN